MLAADIDACEALAQGIPVPIDRLNETLVEALGLTGEVVMDDSLALRVEVNRSKISPTTHAPTRDEPGELLEFVRASDFAAINEPSAEPLLGDEEQAEITAGSTVLFYGDGGAGKTTLGLDAAVHLAAGKPWLGFNVPRKLKILLVENEGPRGPFRNKIRRKLAQSLGDAALNIYVLEEPWARLNLKDDEHLAALRAWVAHLEADIVMLGPVVSIGFAGAGTPDEIEAHGTRLALLRHGLAKPLVVWLLHHENKAGDVSGAWERLPDTLVHVRLSEGGGYTNITWKKARWSSRTHGKKMTLRWTDGEGFELIDADSRANAINAEIIEALDWLLAHVAEHPGIPKGDAVSDYIDARKGAKGARSRIRTAIEISLGERPEHPVMGETERQVLPMLQRGPGKSPSGTYLYPASQANLPLADQGDGNYGNLTLLPAGGHQDGSTCQPAAPYKGEAGSGKLRVPEQEPGADNDIDW